MKLKIKGSALQVFIYVSKYGGPKRVAYLKRRFAGWKPDRLHSAIEFLTTIQYCNLNDDIISLTEMGRAYLNEYNSFGNELIFNKKYDDAILDFLYQMEDLFPFDDFPDNILRHAPTYGNSISKGYNLQGYLNFTSLLKPYIFCNGREGMLNTDGRHYFENLTIIENQRREKDKIEADKEKLTIENLEYTIDKLKLDLKNYSKIIRQKNAAYIISLISISLAIVSTIILLFKK